MSKQKEFWEWNGEELCNSAGVLTLASKMNGGIRPSKTTLRKWLAHGLAYKSFISRSYVFRVETVKKFLDGLAKPKEQFRYTKQGGRNGI